MESKDLKATSKHQESPKKNEQTQDVVVKFLSFICVGGAYGLIAISLVQVYILVSWLNS